MQNYTVLNRNLRLLLLTLSILAMMWTVISFQTQKKPDIPIFSKESGFYEKAFYLELTAPEGCSIYYTLDSSIPTSDSIRYTGPIYIDNASLHENTYSMITEVAASQMLIAPPDYLIDKCTVVRAIAISDSMQDIQSSAIVTKSYFVELNSDDFDNCGIISLVTDPENLFDYKKGIYVTGEIFDNFLKNTEITNENSSAWPSWDANYNQRGSDWERDAHITFWDSNGTLLLTKNIGIRVQGGWSRGLVPRSLNLFARKKYDGTDHFEHNFFGKPHQLSSLTLSAGGSGGYISRLNDYLMSECVKDLSYSVMSYKPYVMFLDGEYWGFYWLTEKYDSQYIQETFNLSASDIIIIKNGLLEEGYEEDLFLVEQMFQFFKNNDMSIESNYKKACELIDIDSFLDYYATMIYIARMNDWPNYNEAFWRTRKVSSAPFADGKWRWILFDCNDFCMSTGIIEHNTLKWVLENSAIFRSLWNNESFRSSFETRIFEIADQYFPVEKMDQFLSDYAETMISPLSKTWVRFIGNQDYLEEDFQKTIDSVRCFYTYRREVVESWFS